MDDADAKAALRRIAGVLKIPVEDLYATRRDGGPDDAELSRLVQSYSRLRDVSTRHFLLHELRRLADAEAGDPER